jgi:phosphotransferase system HPr-like phosphotransfer protein
VREPLRVRVADEGQAASLARSLSGLEGLDVRHDTTGCEIAVEGVDSDRAVIAVLDAIRDTLAGAPTSSAHVRLDGREYHMQGE